jgi:predicted alpha/beta-fold hydrolase
MSLEVVLGLAVAVYALYYLCFVGKEPEVHHCPRDGSRAARLARDLPILREKFWPTPGLDNTHLQTLLGVVGRRRADIELRTECFPLADGGELYLDWTVAAKNPRVTCVILHGTQGSSRSRYIRQFLRTGVAQNWRCVVLHQRGCGVSPLRVPKTFHAGLTADTKEVMEAIYQRHAPTSQVIAVGFSLGANILAKYLGEEGPQAKVDGAVLLSNPWDFGSVGEQLSQGSSRLYSHLLKYEMNGYVRRHWDQLRQMECLSKKQLDDILSLPSLLDLDLYLAVLPHGFADRKDYVKKVSSAHLAHNIGVPTLALNAHDDPICPSASVPVHVTHENENIVFGLTDRGGHLAWLEGWDFWEEAWMDRAVVQFSKALWQHMPERRLRKIYASSVPLATTTCDSNERRHTS